MNINGIIFSSWAKDHFRVEKCSQWLVINLMSKMSFQIVWILVNQQKMALIADWMIGRFLWMVVCSKYRKINQTIQLFDKYHLISLEK